MKIRTPQEEIERLVKKYEDLTGKEIKEYNEEITKNDFILPLFGALGWDVHNVAASEVWEE